uniref:DUF2867 domain-containing protein n=1 Tax=Sphingomonas sp. CFBP 8765 TaxID=2775274 RepID=UPI002016F0D4
MVQGAGGGARWRCRAVRRANNRRATPCATGSCADRLLPVLAESTDEIVLGEDDRYLDFRLSILRQVGPHGSMLIVTTAVRTRNRFGRLYLRAIYPFHVLVARASLIRAAARR